MVSRQKARARVAYWQRRLGLDHWKVTVVFSHPKDYAAQSWVNDETLKFDTDYLECEVYLNLKKIEESKDSLDAFILHELVGHPGFWPIAALAVKLAGKNKRLLRLVEQAEEQTATMIERTLLAAFGLTKT